MSNSAFIAALGSVAAAIFFLASAICAAAAHSTITRVMFVVGLFLAAAYLFVSLFWGVRATMLESFQLKKDGKE